MRNTNGRSRKRVHKPFPRILGIAMLILCAIAAVVAGYCISITRQNSKTTPNKPVSKSMSIIKETMSETIPETAKATKSEPDEKTGSSQERTDVKQQKEQDVVLEKQLTSLSGIAPGTILQESQFDFSNLKQYFNSWNIEEGDNLYARIIGKSWQPNDNVPLESLVYIKMPHYNFDGDIQVGEMIVNKDIEEDIKNIFCELFEAKYEIQSMYLIDNYWAGDGDKTDTASIDVNNTSAFCYRPITGGSKLSNHAYGRAIDLNPQQNPYVSYSTGKAKWSHKNADDYIARDTGLAHVITHEDLAYKTFSKYGFSWGGDWTNPKDYQHFEKK